MALVSEHVEESVNQLKKKNYDLIGEKKTLAQKIQELEGKSSKEPGDDPPKKLDDGNKSQSDPVLLKMMEKLENLEKDLQRTRLSNIKGMLVKDYLNDAKNPNIILSQLDLSKINDVDGKLFIKAEDGSDTDLKQVFDQMRKSEDTSFLFGKPSATKTVKVMGMEFNLSDLQDDKGSQESIPNPWLSSSFNLTKQNEILRANPELAGKFKEEAKAKATEGQNNGQGANQAPNPITTPSPMFRNPFA